MTAYHEYFSPGTLAIDLGSRGFFDDDDEAHVVDRPLDPSEDFSPKTAEWAEFSDQETLSSTSTAHAFLSSHPNALALRPHLDSWPSSACTPTPVYDGFAAEYQHDVAAPYVSATVASATGPTTFELHAGHEARSLSIFPPPGSAEVSSFPTSPLGGWTSPTRIDLMDARVMPKRVRPGSPGGSHSPLLRRDGIRKKNARFEIPAERNLLNIDQLIAQSSDDHEIKELKQQKRLLRNRQAALDSRQRKKQHTERLEEDKKHYTNIISDLEEELAQLKVREADHLRREDEWKANQQRYEQYVEGLHLEKEEMIRRHTLESADLRKKNAFLTEHLQKAESTAMSTMPSSSGFPADFSEADSLPMDGNPWDSHNFLPDFSIDHDVKPDPATFAVVPRRTDKVSSVDEEKPATSGLLLLLLLCGAFVASKSSSTSSPNIPRMPENIRAASATVLDNIFKDAGVAPEDPRSAPITGIEALKAEPSRPAWAGPSSGMGANRMIGLTASSLDVLQQQLVLPSKQQEHEQLFALTAAQYNGVVSHDLFREPEPADVSRGQRDLGASLAAMRNDNKGAAAEVYTRSLLWDKVPAEVVREFARFVADSAAHDQRQKASTAGG